MNWKEEIERGLACDSVGKPESIIGRTVCLSVHPGKMILFPFIKWFEKRYKGKYKFARTMFSFDLLLIGLVIGLGVAALILSFYTPQNFENKIYFDAAVAPREVIAGANSTLVIRYTNGTNEELRDATLHLDFPAHFLLQEISIEDVEVTDDVIELGTIPVGGTGSVRIRGVMFGDVGGEQSFTSVMRFVHGFESNLAGQKTDIYTFSPTSSTLALELTLPERLVAFQTVEGTITYNNTGEIDFPVISIAPEWPDGFSSIASATNLVNNAYELPAIEAGEQGELMFEGYLGDVGDEVTFIFYPSFTFDDTRYAQETLVHSAPVVLPQVAVNHGIEKTLRPGETIEVTVSYENTGEFSVYDVELGISSDSAFFANDSYTVGADEYPGLATLEPGEKGMVTVSVPLRSSILQSETDEYENIDITTRSIATYTLGDETGQRVSSRGSEITAPLTSPVVLESFGRYATSSGDQLGRGPLPPRVGIETKYWVFWNVSGTTNELTNVFIEGSLADNVRFTGRQTVSQNGGVEYNSETHTISWISDSIKPTLSPSSKVAAVAFELGITPTKDQIGTTPTILSDIYLTASDARTGAIVSTSGYPVTTNLPNDAIASGLGKVQ